MENLPHPVSEWDRRYMRLSCIVASWSKDPSTQCGAVLVRPDKTLASVGYNGFSRHISDDRELYEDRNSKYPRTIHSEWNAIRSARDHTLEGYSVYAWPMSPCNQCSAALIQKKIKRIVYMKPTQEKLSRWGKKFEFAMNMLRQRNITVDMMDEGEHLRPVQNEKSHTVPVFYKEVPKWQQRFLTVAHEVCSWSKDPISPRGAVLVRNDKTIASVGFSGLPQGIDDQPLLQGDVETRDNMLVAAERNLLLFGRDPSNNGHTAYLWPGPPSLDSLAHLIHEGIKTIVYPQKHPDERLDEELDELLGQVGGKAIAVPWSGDTGTLEGLINDS